MPISHYHLFPFILAFTPPSCFFKLFQKGRQADQYHWISQLSREEWIEATKIAIISIKLYKNSAPPPKWMGCAITLFTYGMGTFRLWIVSQIYRLVHTCHWIACASHHPSSYPHGPTWQLPDHENGCWTVTRRWPSFVFSFLSFLDIRLRLYPP